MFQYFLRINLNFENLFWTGKTYWRDRWCYILKNNDEWNSHIYSYKLCWHCWSSICMLWRLCKTATGVMPHLSLSLSLVETSCRLLHGQPKQPFVWNYFPLLTGRIVLSNKKRNLNIYSVVFFKHFQKKYLANLIQKKKNWKQKFCSETMGEPSFIECF